MIRRLNSNTLQLDDKCPNCTIKVTRVLRGLKWLTDSKSDPRKFVLVVETECHCCGTSLRFNYTGSKASVM